MTTKIGKLDTRRIFKRTAEVTTMDWFYLSRHHVKPIIFEQLTQGNDGLKRVLAAQITGSLLKKN
jgi:hypothetical protein